MSSSLAPPVPHAAVSPVGDFSWHAETVQLLVLSGDGNVLQWNETAHRWLGGQAQLRPGLPVWELLTHNSASLLRENMGQARSRPARGMLLSFSDGASFAVTLTCSLYWMGDSWYLYGEQSVEGERRMNEELLALTSDLACANRERAKLAAQLQRTLAELRTSHWQIRRIQEHLPICAVCHKVPSGAREGGHWESLIQFLARNGLLMTHGYCPECEAAALAELDRLLPPHPAQDAAPTG